MTEKSLRWLQVGKQTGTTDTPTFYFIEFQDDDFYPDTSQEKIPVKTQRDDGEMAASVNGREQGAFSFQTHVKGKGSGAGDGTIATTGTIVSGAPVDGSFDVLMDCLMGFNGQHGTGDTSDVSSHTTTRVDLADPSLFFDGTTGTEMASGIMMDTDSAGTYRWEAREVATKNAGDLVPDRPFQEAPASAGVIYAACSWYPAASSAEHSHCYFKAEGDGFARHFLGCGLQLKIDWVAGEPATYSWDVVPNDVDRNATPEATPTYVSPSSAVPIFGKAGTFHIDSTKTTLLEGHIVLNFVPEGKPSTEGAQGTDGMLYTYSGADFSGKIYFNQTTKTAFESTATQDLGIQLGETTAAGTPGNCLYIRIPNFDCQTVKDASQGAVDILDFGGKCSRPTAGKGSIRFHVFASDT